MRIEMFEYVCVVTFCVFYAAAVFHSCENTRFIFRDICAILTYSIEEKYSSKKNKNSKSAFQNPLPIGASERARVTDSLRFIRITWTIPFGCWIQKEIETNGDTLVGTVKFIGGSAL